MVIEFRFLTFQLSLRTNSLCICLVKITNDRFIIGVYEDQVTRIRQALEGAFDS